MMRLTIKGSPASGWYAPPKGTHSGEEHRAVGSGKVVSKRTLVRTGLGSSPISGKSPIPGNMRGMNEAHIIEYEDGSKALFKPQSGMGVGSVAGEVLTYEFSKSLGWDLVPETITTEIDGKVGSLQQWVPDSQTGTSFSWEDQPAYRGLVHGQAYARMMAMDRLLHNNDRHDDNWLRDGNGKLWAIDNGDSGNKKSISKSASNLASRITFYARGSPPQFDAAYKEIAKWSSTPGYQEFRRKVVAHSHYEEGVTGQQVALYLDLAVGELRGWAAES